jgi:hypothetical protein
VIDPSLFTVERILAAMFDDMSGNRDSWRKFAQIVPDFMPRFPDTLTRPTCVVKLGDSYLRYSKGPRQGYFWDMYGDDMLSPENALLALLRAPVPPFALKREAFTGEMFKAPTEGVPTGDEPLRAFRQANAFREVLEEIADDSCRCAPDWRCPRCLSREVLANAAKPLRPIRRETHEP